MATAKPIGKKKVISVDFSNTESSGPREIPEGEYLLQIAEFEEKESQSGNPMISFTHKVAEGPYKGAKVWDNISLTPQALWRFRAMLESLGIDASKKVDVDLNALKGKILRVKISLETYNGKDRPRITDFLQGTAGLGKSSGGSSIKKGSNVVYDHEGSEVYGVVNSISGNTATVLVDVGDDSQEEWEIDVSDLKLA